MITFSIFWVGIDPQLKKERLLPCLWDNTSIKFQATEKSIFGGDFNVDLLSDSTFSTDFVTISQNNGYNPLMKKNISRELGWCVFGSKSQKKKK